jgi:organizing structure protein 2
MFRKHALRASRTVYMSSASAAGVIATERASSEEQNILVDLVTDSPAQSAEVEIAPIAVALPKRVLIELPDKLSIYPKPKQILVLLDTPSPLELRIGQVRRELCGYYSGARAHVQDVIDRWIHVEDVVESRIKSFRDPSEPLNPGLLYTGISALTTSVLVRSRSLPTRFLLPPLSLLGAFAYFLPRTAGRVSGWVEDLEGQYAPRVGEVRRTGVAHTSMAWEMLGEKVRVGKEGLGKGARGVVDGIESSTGLKLGDAVGWTKAASNKTPGSDEDKKA